MKIKQSLVILLLLASLLLTSCDIIVNLNVSGTGESTEEGEGSGSAEESAPPEEPLYEAEGTLYSTESDLLILFVEWEAVTYDGKVATVTLTPGISCYSMSTGKHDLFVTVNDETKQSQTPPIVSTANEKKKFSFADFTFEVEMEENGTALLDIAVAWDYNGSYNGQRLEMLTAAARITFPDGGIELPSTDTEESETTEPTDTTAPPVDTDPPLFSESGVMYSAESDMLVLYTKWEAISRDGLTADVALEVGIVCYSLSTGRHKLTVKVNDQSKFVYTRAIENTVDEKKTIKLHTFHFEIPLDEEAPNLLDLAVVWDFNGSYSGHPVEKLTLADLVTLPGGAASDTDETTQESEPLDPREDQEEPLAAPVADGEEDREPQASFVP